MHYTLIRVLNRFVFILLLLQPAMSLAADQYAQIVNGEQVVSIDYHASLDKTERKMIYRWLNEVTAALLTVYNELPKKNYHISIERSLKGSSPVPWGQVKRGTPTEVLLVVNPEAGYNAFINDWTAFHEFSHLLIPYRGYGDVWLSEGLATYYQNIIQARSEQFSDVEMWDKIASGLKRGRNEQRWRHINLTAVSDNLRETRQYMRVHWSGVLFWLTVDVELRKQNKGSLDEALKQLRDCCEGQSMSAREIVHKLDELTDNDMFAPLFEKYCETYATPDFKPMLTSLGVKRDKMTGGISFDNAATLAHIRQQMHQKNHSK